jgi:hypothetical protein
MSMVTPSAPSLSAAPMQTAEETAPRYDACCKCTFQIFQIFKGILQVFHKDVAKIDRDVAYVIAMGYTSMFQVYVPNVFGCMSQVFHLEAAKTRSERCMYIQVFQVFLYVS